MKNLILTFVFAITSLASFSQGHDYFNVIVTTNIDTLVIDSTWYGYSNGGANLFAERAYNKYYVYILDTDSIINVKFKYLNNDNPAINAYRVWLNNEPLGFVQNIALWDIVIYDSLININHDSLTTDTVFARATNTDNLNTWFKIVKVTQVQWDSIQNAEATVGINNLELSTTRLSAYPNPATDQVTIDFDVTTNEIPVTIYSTSGKLVYSSQDKPTNGTNSLTIDVSTFNKGIYLVKAGSSVQKLIVE